MSTDTFVKAAEFEGDFKARSYQLVSNTVLFPGSIVLDLARMLG